jgi:hypothetical protein
MLQESLSSEVTRLSVKTSDVVFFFGAGASAPFGIPTMQQFVTDFEDLLTKNGTSDERSKYNDIKNTLRIQLNRPVDLEAIFTVIDGILNYGPERLGLFSTYITTGFKSINDLDIKTCRSLKEKFQTFVSEQCIIPEGSFDKIKRVYHDFFNRFALELRKDQYTVTSGTYAWDQTWMIFTTNYDLCLEYYWRETARIGIDTGFEFDNARSANRLRPLKYLAEGVPMRLFKLHGSINWLIEKETGEVIEQEMAKGHSHLGRMYEGEMMVYPIAEKQLYFDPYISMLLRLNRELERRPVWVVIGYSFNDPIIKEIFIRRSTMDKHFILVHPDATEISNGRLQELKGKKTLLSQKFGLEEDFRKVNCNIIHSLKVNPKYNSDNTPIE